MLSSFSFSAVGVFETDLSFSFSLLQIILPKRLLLARQQLVDRDVSGPETSLSQCLEKSTKK